MRRTLIASISTLVLAAAAWPLAAQAAAAKLQVEKTRTEPLIEQIHHQDKSVTIDEVRVGGQTQSIEVKPSNEKLRPYQVEPQRGDAGIKDKSDSKNLTNRSWKLFNF